MVGPLKSRFEPLPERRDSVLAEYNVILELHNKLQSSQPDIASELWSKIQNHIKRLDTSDPS